MDHPHLRYSIIIIHLKSYHLQNRHLIEKYYDPSQIAERYRKRLLEMWILSMNSLRKALYRVQHQHCFALCFQRIHSPAVYSGGCMISFLLNIKSNGRILRPSGIKVKGGISPLESS